MPYILRGRNESAVYFEYEVDLQKADAFVRAWNQANPMLRVDLFHLTVWAMRDAMLRNPSVQRFVSGGRLYDRTSLWFSYAVKRKLETGAPLAVVKRRFDLDESFAAMVEGMAAETAKVTSTTDSPVERELALLLKFPGFMRRIIMATIRTLNRWGLLSRSFIEKDPMFTTVFFANMASFGMPAVYHHLYEYGTAGVFCSVGRPVGAPGSPTSGPDRRRIATLKFTFDERVEDGLAAWFSLRRIKQILEDPETCGLTLEARPGGSVEAISPEQASERDPIDGTVAPVDS